ncbi:unnamed protein product [Adineta ricciae]|uniref:Uncharacterized protein n=1 Tax=Adineta ricciae TaxID=249248 RepID=A0A815P4C5_ADIRI|nr:unnamed protein product [Adineta ricciae]
MASPSFDDLDLIFDNDDGKRNLHVESISIHNDNDPVLPVESPQLPENFDDLGRSATIAISPQNASTNLQSNMENDPAFKCFWSTLNSEEMTQLLTEDSNDNQNILVKSTDIVEYPFFVDDCQQQYIYIEVNNPISIKTQPCADYHVRYEGDNKPSPRYTKAADKKAIQIDFSPDLSDIWRLWKESGYIPWMRITRTTAPNSDSNVIFRHPYPIWMKNNRTKVHDGSIYIQISDDDISNGYIKIENLIMVSIKQDKLAMIDRFAIYNPLQTLFSEYCNTHTNNAKTIIDTFNLRRSKLCFQIMMADVVNTVYPMNCCCETIAMTEYTGKKTSAESDELSSSKKRKRNEEQFQLRKTKAKKAKSGHT